MCGPLQPFTEHNAFKVHPGCRISIGTSVLFIAEYYSTASCLIHPEMDTTRCLSNHQWKVIFIFSPAATLECTRFIYPVPLSAVLRGISAVSNFLLLRIVESWVEPFRVWKSIFCLAQAGRGWWLVLFQCWAFSQ